jgi:predicted DNA-binding protein (MmcQ/YjbR family)
MRLEAFDALCASLPGATMVVQWGESHVHKVGGKVFAMAADA